MAVRLFKGQFSVCAGVDQAALFSHRISSHCTWMSGIFNGDDSK
jgi:hypothetical protein